MNAVLAPLRELVRRRLWPVAILLLGAAVAAPAYLGTEPEVPPVASAPRDAFETDPLTGEAFVSVKTEDGVERRRVLGASKDPFRPTGVQPKAKKPTTFSGTAPSTASVSGPSDSSAPASASFSGGAAGPTGGGPTGSAPALTGSPVVPLAPAPPKAAPKSYELYSLSVRFAGDRRTLKRLDPLPDAETPAIIYLGLLDDEKSAVFLLDSTVKADGDGSCHPSPSDCQRLYLEKGETAFFDVTAEGGATQEYQLDLLSIHTKKTKSAKAATAAYSIASPRGRRALRSRMNRVGRLRYDARTGKLRLLSPKGWRASVARSAAR